MKQIGGKFTSLMVGLSVAVRSFSDRGFRTRCLQMLVMSWAIDIKLLKQSLMAAPALTHRQLARWGERAVATGLGIEEYHETTRDTHDFGRRVGQLPEQRETDGDVDYRSLLHRDGSVLSAVTLEVGAARHLLPSVDQQSSICDTCAAGGLHCEQPCSSGSCQLCLREVLELLCSKSRCQCHLLHGTILDSNVQDLKQPELMYRALGCKLAVGMPFKDLATSDSLFLRDVPPADDKQARLALSRLAVSHSCFAS